MIKKIVKLKYFNLFLYLYYGLVKYYCNGKKDFYQVVGYSKRV